jgi:uncharacterized protein (DUF58 family)
VLFLLALTLIGSGAFVTGNNMLFLIFSAMLALLLVSGFLGRLVLAGLELELLLPRHIAARALTDARIRLRNLKMLTPSFSIELYGRHNPLTGVAPILQEPVYFPVIPGAGEVEVPVKVTFPFRGRHRENLFVLTTRFPFGFLRREATIPITRDTLVFPAIEAGEGSERLLAGIEGEVAAQQRGRGQDFYRIRPWEASDGTRMVDWKSTAHTGELQAREFAQDEHAAVSVVLDCSIPAGGEQRFEQLLEECAYLLWMLQDRGTDFEFISGNWNSADVYAALGFLATVQPYVAVRRGEVPAAADGAGSAVVLSVWS